MPRRVLWPVTRRTMAYGLRFAVIVVHGISSQMPTIRSHSPLFMHIRPNCSSSSVVGPLGQPHQIPTIHWAVGARPLVRPVMRPIRQLVDGEVPAHETGWAALQLPFVFRPNCLSSLSSESGYRLPKQRGLSCQIISMTSQYQLRPCTGFYPLRVEQCPLLSNPMNRCSRPNCLLPLPSESADN